jgi:murein L,D-transpeptidase YcbB/YkuD
MSFSFNWAGLNTPTVNYTKAIEDADFGKNLGIAARGFENRQAAKDYADKIDTYRMGRNAQAGSNKSRIAEIKEEIARLKQENADIDALLAQSQPQPTQEVDVYSQPAKPLTDEELQALVFNPSTATRDEIRAMQSRIGTKADGLWGNKSQAAWDAKYGYLLDASNGITFGGY